MSGGHFDYAYSRLSNYADQLEDDIVKDAVEETLSAETLEYLKTHLQQCRKVSAIMKEVEWLYSGDSGEDTFKKRLTEIEQKF